MGLTRHADQIGHCLIWVSRDRIEARSRSVLCCRSSILTWWKSSSFQDAYKASHSLRIPHTISSHATSCTWNIVASLSIKVLRNKFFWSSVQQRCSQETTWHKRHYCKPSFVHRVRGRHNAVKPHGLSQLKSYLWVSDKKEKEIATPKFVFWVSNPAP